MKTKEQTWDLDAPLIHFNSLKRLIPWTIGESCEGLINIGSPGSGKTSGPLTHIPMAAMQAGYGGLVLSTKSDEADRLRELAIRCGRGDDVVMFGAGRPWRYNYLDELKKGGADSIIKAQREINVSIMGGKAEVNEWTLSAESHLRNLIDLFRLAGQSIDLYKLRITTSNLDRQKQLLELARKNTKPADKQLLLLLFTYFTTEFLKMSDKTRQGILMALNPTLEPFCRGELYKLFCTETNIRPEDCRHGKIIICAIPIIDDADVAGRAANSIWKYMLLRKLQSYFGKPGQRSADDSTRPVFVCADECQYIASREDSIALTTTRSARIAMLYATQSIPNFHIREGKAKEETQALLPSLKTRIVCQMSCPITVNWFNEQVGKVLTDKESQSANFGESGSGGASINQSKEVQFGIEDLSCLPFGRKVNRFVVCGIFSKANRVFEASNKVKKNWIQLAFPQMEQIKGIPEEAEYIDDCSGVQGLTKEEEADLDKMLSEYDKPRNDFD